MADSPEEGYMIAAAQKGDVGMFAQFGGQATPFLKELKELYFGTPEGRAFVHQGLATLREVGESEEARGLGLFSSASMTVRLTPLGARGRRGSCAPR